MQNRQSVTIDEYERSELSSLSLLDRRRDFLFTKAFCPAETVAPSFIDVVAYSRPRTQKVGTNGPE